MHSTTIGAGRKANSVRRQLQKNMITVTTTSDVSCKRTDGSVPVMKLWMFEVSAVIRRIRSPGVRLEMELTLMDCTFA